MRESGKVPSAYSGNRVPQGDRKGLGKGQSEVVTTLQNSELWNLVEEVGGTRLPHCHISTISPLSSNAESLSNN